jgi:succinate-semialdehyde dehydrogenase/glutarate-semialdehyde dehydrogenase
MAAATLLPVRNPRTGECDYDMPIVPAAEIAPIVEALRVAQSSWFALGATARAQCLNRFADAVMTEVEPLAAALAIDTLSTPINSLSSCRGNQPLECAAAIGDDR